MEILLTCCTSEDSKSTSPDFQGCFARVSGKLNVLVLSGLHGSGPCNSWSLNSAGIGASCDGRKERRRLRQRSHRCPHPCHLLPAPRLPPHRRPRCQRAWLSSCDVCGG